MSPFYILYIIRNLSITTISNGVNSFRQQKIQFIESNEFMESNKLKDSENPMNSLDSIDYLSLR